MGNSSSKTASSTTKETSTSVTSTKSSKNKGDSALTKKKKVEFKLHIAIDFGTDGCGVAIAHKNKVHIFDKWKGTQRGRTMKTKTHMLLNEKNAIMAFGNNAKFVYSELEGKQKKSYKFFERFKMALYEEAVKSGNAGDIKDNNDNDDDDDGVDTKTYIEASNGKTLLSSIVFEEAFKHLQEKAKGNLFKIIKKADDMQAIKDEEIQWILTVPAIWSESAKDKMRRWIINAGLINGDVIDQCIIVYEPDCASLAIQKEYFQHMYDNDGNEIVANPTPDDDDDDDDGTDDMKQNDRFEPGDKYILVDAGGGTVDIACHEILNDGSVAEIVWPTGGDWGSCYIDDLYITLLGDIFGKDVIDYYRDKDPTEYVKITGYFEDAKKKFYEKGQQNQKIHRVQLPFEFTQYLEEKCDNIENIVHGYCKSARYFEHQKWRQNQYYILYVIYNNI